MGHYVGVDLGTTNSAICIFDGVDTRVLKSPEQSDVTPSAIYVDRHGRRFYGRRAYEMAPADEANAATLFKRYLGTTMRFSFASSGEELTPEQCSAEILRELFGYLPPELRDDPTVGTVITVPAAFNQMKRDATTQAAELANIGQVAIMQEPVAAVMSVMKDEPVEGIFLVFDLGGGTFDISVAESAGGQVSLLAQGGKEMCGGRDWDRLLWREVALPWLRENFNLPSDIMRNPQYRRLRQLALYACEQAKIELSMRDEAYVQMDEFRIAQRDLDGTEIYLDVPVSRAQLDALIKDLLSTCIEVTKETVAKAGVELASVHSIVFIGGPTMYPPLQDRVMRELGIANRGTSNPMTAVAEGASIYAESIDWSSSLHERKEAIQRATEADFDIAFERRTSGDCLRLALSHHGGESFSAEVVGEADGWSSGRLTFDGRGVMRIPLAKRGENVFHLSLYDARGQQVTLVDDRLVVERVLATVNAIPASHALALKVLDRVGGKPVPVYLVHENERLPKRGTVVLRAGERLVAGSSKALVFTLWEGEIADPIEDNRYIGTYRIPGSSFATGVINVGDEIQCEYEIGESGQLQLGVTVPAVRSVFAKKNYYSRYEGQLVLDDPSDLLKSGQALLVRLTELKAFSHAPELEAASAKLVGVLENLQSDDPEVVQQAADDLLDCRRAVARYRQGHLKDVRLLDLEGYALLVKSYESELSPAHKQMLDELYDAARRAIRSSDESFDTILSEYRQRSWQALQGSHRFIVNQFEVRVANPGNYEDIAQFNELKAEGQACIVNGDYGRLSLVIGKLGRIRKKEERSETESETMFEDVNVLRG